MLTLILTILTLAYDLDFLSPESYVNLWWPSLHMQSMKVTLLHRLFQKLKWKQTGMIDRITFSASAVDNYSTSSWSCWRHSFRQRLHALIESVHVSSNADRWNLSSYAERQLASSGDSTGSARHVVIADSTTTWYQFSWIPAARGATKVHVN